MAAVGGFIQELTGAGRTDGVLDMYCADLGIPRWDPDRNAYAVMYGDNYQFRFKAGDWRSPSIVMYDENFTPIGVPTADPLGIEQRPVCQLWPYVHNNAEYSTVLPTDFIRVGDSWYVSVMVTQGLANELRTEFWRSPDLVNWSGPILSLPHQPQPLHPGNTMLTFDVIDTYVYLFGTGGLARNKPVWLWRNPVDQFPLGLWEPFGCNGTTWDWGTPNEDTPVLLGQYGELCFRYLDGKSVLSYFDACHYRMTARVVGNPWDYVDQAQVVDYAFGWSTPQLYGGYIWPQSKLDTPSGMKFVVSQWNTATDDPYHAMVFTATLNTGAPPVSRLPTAAAVTLAAKVTTATAGGLGGAAVNGVLGGIQGVAAGLRHGWARSTGAGKVAAAATHGVVAGVQGSAAGAREGWSAGSRSTATAALTMASLGTTGIAELPVVGAVGGTALLVRELNRRSQQQSLQTPPQSTASNEAITVDAAADKVAPARKPGKTSPSAKSGKKPATGARGRPGTQAAKQTGQAGKSTRKSVGDSGSKSATGANELA